MIKSISDYFFKKLTIEPKKKYVYFTVDGKKSKIKKESFSMTLNFNYEKEWTTKTHTDIGD